MTHRHRGRWGAGALRAVFVLLALVLGMSLIAPPAARAADVLPGWGQWWLPPDRSTHGAAIDTLFYWIFWITMITFIGVELVLIVFLIKYRQRPEKKKAVFTHGNTRLEMAWTLAPALILAALALGSKKAWDAFRYSPDLDNPDRAKVLVIGERFKWNIIYPGPDGKFGRYLIYPKPTDPLWPAGPDGKPIRFAGVEGPASLPYDRALSAITSYILNENPLGKDFADPDGKDDNFDKMPGRQMIVPVNRPIEVQLGSKDVLHSFFLPNHRVKLDTVPGMRGRIVFTATMTSKEMEDRSRNTYSIDEVAELVKRPQYQHLTVAIEEGTPGADFFKQRGAAYWRYADENKRTIVRAGGVLTPDVVERLRAAGFTEIVAYLPGYWDIVCEELCGEGHSRMQGQLVVVSQEEYNALKRDRIPGTTPPPSPAPTVALK